MNVILSIAHPQTGAERLLDRLSLALTPQFEVRKVVQS